MEFAPIILFVYERLEQTSYTIESLKKNHLSKHSDLFIFSDGPKSTQQVENVKKVRDYIHSISGFKSVTIYESNTNKGLARSIVDGVTQLVNEYDKIIVLEDDIVTSPYFLQFMNDALKFYEMNEKVMSISGYMYPHKENLPETFFFNVPLCWGWATWSRAWNYFNNNSSYHLELLNKNKNWKSFNKFGGKYLERQLKLNVTGKLNTWFINWHASVFHKNGFCLYPNKTLVNNTAFDSSGEHSSSTNVYYSALSGKQIVVNTIELKENQLAKKIVKRFYIFKTNLLKRTISKVLRQLK